MEIKCGKSTMREAQRGVIPKYYYGQIQHQLMVTGLEKLTIGVIDQRRVEFYLKHRVIIHIFVNF